jgi:O-antigen/teichoic acid export membrane protein
MTEVSASSTIPAPAKPARAARGPARLEYRPASLGLIKRLISSQLRVNIASGFVTTAVNVFLMLVSYPLYLHFLGYEKVGVWLLLSSVQNFAQLGVVGIGPALTKLVAEELGREDAEGAQRYVSLATITVSVTGAVAVLALWALRVPGVRALGLSAGNADIAIKLLPFVGLLTGLTFLNQVVVSALSGVGRMDISNYCITAAKVAALGLEVTLLCRGWGVETLLLGDVLGCCVIQVVGHVYLQRRTGIRMLRRHPWDAARFTRLMRFSGSVFVASLTSLLVAPLNKVALSNYAGVALVPVFEIAFNGTMQLRSLAQVALGALMPAVSQRGAAGTAEARRDIRRLYDRSLYYLLIITPPCYALALLLARPLLKLWLGARYVPQIETAVDILWASALVSLIAVPAFYVLMATDGVRSCVMAHILSAAANIVWIGGCIAFRGTVSLRGASFAILAANVVSSAYLLIRNRRAMGMSVVSGQLSVVSGPSSIVDSDMKPKQLTTDHGQLTTDH